MKEPTAPLAAGPVVLLWMLTSIPMSRDPCERTSLPNIAHRPCKSLPSVSPYRAHLNQPAICPDILRKTRAKREKKKKRDTPSISVVGENAIPFFNFTSAVDLCGKNKEITMARMYEIEPQRDALFV